MKIQQARAIWCVKITQKHNFRIGLDLLLRSWLSWDDNNNVYESYCVYVVRCMHFWRWCIGSSLRFCFSPLNLPFLEKIKTENKDDEVYNFVVNVFEVCRWGKEYTCNSRCCFSVLFPFLSRLNQVLKKILNDGWRTLRQHQRSEWNKTCARPPIGLITFDWRLFIFSIVQVESRLCTARHQRPKPTRIILYLVSPHHHWHLSRYENETIFNSTIQ